MMTDNFLNYKNFRWLWLNLAFLGILLGIYIYDNPIGGRNGGTWLGWIYGAIATLGILYLMWFGIRKRSHYAKYTTLKGCLAVHVWLGIALSVIVPLHSGFSFGLNVHTLAYALMVMTIVSGICGAYIYLRYPPKVQSHRGGGTIRSLLEQIQVLSSDIEFLAKDRSDHFLKLFDTVDFLYKPSVTRAIFQRKIHEVLPKDVANLLAKLPKSESDEGYQLVSLAAKKKKLAEQIDNEVRLSAVFRSWLYLHLPVSFALLAAVATHIFSVFFFR